MEPTALENLVEGAVSIEPGDGWIKPWRLPYTQRRLFPPDDGIVMTAEAPAGVRLRFATDSPRLELAVLAARQPRRFDLTSGDALLRSVVLPAGEEVVAFDGLAPASTTYECWLPQTLPVALRELRVVEGATLNAVPDQRPRWITYGSSISQCGAAHSPARTWPATVARERGLNLTCLGFSGQCHMEPLIGRVIRDLPADVITLKVGINVQGGATLSGRTLRPALIGLVTLIREGHPQVPIVVVSPIVSPPREDQPNVVGMSLGVLRAQLRDAVQRLQDCGDPNVHYVDGTEIFGPAEVEHLPDLLHPDGDGYEILGHNFSRVVFGLPALVRSLPSVAPGVAGAPLP